MMQRWSRALPKEIPQCPYCCNASKPLAAAILAALALFGASDVAIAMDDDGTNYCHGHNGEQAELDTDGDGEPDTIRCKDGMCTKNAGMTYYRCDPNGDPVDEGGDGDPHDGDLPDGWDDFWDDICSIFGMAKKSPSGQLRAKCPY